MRMKVVFIFVNADGKNIIHFCCHDVLTGSNHDLWFPIADKNNLFQEVERIMINCKVANNVTQINRIRGSQTGKGFYEDYEVIYNAA